MNWRSLGISLALALGITGLIVALRPLERPGRAEENLPVERMVLRSEVKDSGSPEPLVSEDAEIGEIERLKQIDKDHMTAIFGGLQAFYSEHGRYPGHLSELVPGYVAAEMLESPLQEYFGRRPMSQDPEAPNLGYGYEFSEVLFTQDRSFQDIKTVQREEWGDVVPLLRSFHDDGNVVNMTWRGDFYETALYWEKDEATLDMVERYGWGPGMQTHRMVDVVLRDEAGNPLAGAEVWAGERRFTHHLPERPYLTDANGVAQIPLGEDADVSELQLRLNADGYAMVPVEYGRGEAPGRIELTPRRSQRVSGQLLDDAGNPVANTRVMVVGQAEADGAAPFINYARTGPGGRWTAEVLPDEAANVSAVRRFPIR